MDFFHILVILFSKHPPYFTKEVYFLLILKFCNIFGFRMGSIWLENGQYNL
jgi:hypothetical protein